MEPSSKKFKLAAIDSMIVAYGQLIQPTTPDEIYAFAEGSLLTKTLSQKALASHFDKLERQGFFWATADKKYVVTPLGDRFAEKSLDAKKRDKLRLLILNKKRYQ